MTTQTQTSTKPASQEFLRRAIDLLGSGLFLLAISPLLIVLAVCVKRSSTGPVFFRQQRVGRDGRLFWLYKFRTMYVASDGPSVTAGGDSRITKIGRRLRRLKLDELPQFYNVFRGDMSLVGPRPEVLKYVEHYTEEQREVLTVRPGITGVSQLEFRDEEALLAGREDVEAFYLAVVMPAKLRLDLQYVRERTIPGDLRLLFRTLTVLLDRKGSKGKS